MTKTTDLVVLGALALGAATLFRDKESGEIQVGKSLGRGFMDFFGAFFDYGYRKGDEGAEKIRDFFKKEQIFVFNEDFPMRVPSHGEAVGISAAVRKIPFVWAAIQESAKDGFTHPELLDHANRREFISGWERQQITLLHQQNIPKFVSIIDQLTNEGIMDEDISFFLRDPDNFGRIRHSPTIMDKVKRILDTYVVLR